MKIKCLLADDQPESLNFLNALCAKEPDLEVVESFRDGLSLVQRMDELDFDACFLDVDMPMLDGFQVAQMLTDKKVIFVSAKKEEGYQAFSLDAIDFITKPVQLTRFKKAVDKLRLAMSAKQNPSREQAAIAHYDVFLNIDKGKKKFHTSDILAIHSPSTLSDGRDKELVLINGKRYLLKNYTIPQLLEAELPPGHFLQIFRSTVIHTKPAFTLVSHDEIEYEFPSEPYLRLSIGRSYHPNFKETFPSID